MTEDDGRTEIVEEGRTESSGHSSSDRSSESASCISALGIPRPALNCIRPCTARTRQRSAGSPTRAAARTASSLCSIPRSRPSLIPHQPGEIEVDGRLERIVALGFRECLAGESHRDPAGWPGSEPALREWPPARLPGAGRGACLLEQCRRTVDVAGDVVHVRCDEQAPMRLVRSRGRREPERLLSELGGRRRCSAGVRRSSRIVEN